jgi:hypothetical protein
MRTGFAKIIENACIPTHFETPEIYLLIADNACHIDYADIRLSKHVH